MQLVYGLPSTKLGGVAEENDDSEANGSDDEFFRPKGQKQVHIRCMHGSSVQCKLYYFFA